jgi:hypothetical protein
MHCHHRCISFLPIRLLLLFATVSLVSCKATIKPLVSVPSYPMCESVSDNGFDITQISNNIKRFNPAKSQTILLKTNWGNPLKTLVVYKYMENGALKYLLLFHVRERAGDDISTVSKMDIVTGLERSQVDILQDASVFIADISDLYFYVTIPDTFFRKIISETESKFIVATYEFGLSNECKSLLTF